jgi:hypothetical protein
VFEFVSRRVNSSEKFILFRSRPSGEIEKLTDPFNVIIPKGPLSSPFDNASQDFLCRASKSQRRDRIAILE